MGKELWETMGKGKGKGKAMGNGHKGENGNGNGEGKWDGDGDGNGDKDGKGKRDGDLECANGPVARADCLCCDFLLFPFHPLCLLAALRQECGLGEHQPLGKPLFLPLV